MDIKSLNRKTVLIRAWKAVTILTCLYLLGIAFMQYNWDPDQQTPTYNLIIGVQIIATAVLRLSKPKRSGIPYLIILDAFTIILASRYLISGTLMNFLLSVPGIITLAVFLADYYLRFFYFGYHKATEVNSIS